MKKNETKGVARGEPKKARNRQKYKATQIVTLKDRYRQKLIEYIGNPDNEFPKRCEMSLLALGLRDDSGVYRHFSPDELAHIEAEGLEIRRSKYASALARVDTGLLKRAAEGDPAAAKLVYQRFEAWNEKLTVSVAEIDKLIERELARIASTGETACIAAPEGDADADEK